MTSLPTWVSVGTTVGALADTAVTWGTHQANDIGLLFVESPGGQAVTLADAQGFVATSSSPQATGATTAGTQLAIYWCRATSSSMTSPTVGINGANHFAARMGVVRGCITSGDPFNVSSGGVKAAASTSVSAAGLTTLVNNSLVIVAISHDLDVSGGQFSAEANTDLGSLTEQQDFSVTAGNGGGIAIYTGSKVTAGVVGATTATVASSINAFISLAMVPVPDFLVTWATNSNIILGVRAA